MHAWEASDRHGRLTAMEERWKILYNEQHRSPTHSVSHYITYLRRYVAETTQKKTSTAATTPDRISEKGQKNLIPDKWETRAVTHESQRSLDSISPMSYFIRKLKLDLKMTFPGFVDEFVQAPNNGLRLLLSLLKNLQTASSNTIGSTPKGSMRMEDYKQSMVDEQDCLLCIKYTLRIRSAVDELVEHNSGLFIVTTCLLSNFLRSRITALEILTLIITGPSSVDKVLDAFTSMRIKYAESTRFKMLINMMHTRGVSHVLFQVSCLRLLNTILNMCKSANMRVFLQYEMEEAGLDWNRIHEGAEGDGLEYDDLRREIHEWKLRYIDVDSILRKIKADLKADFPGNAITEFHYDQHYGPVYSTAITDMEEFRRRGHQTDSNAVKGFHHHDDVMYPYPPKPSSSQALHKPLHIDIQPPTPEGHHSYRAHDNINVNDQPIYEVISRTPSPAVTARDSSGHSGLGPSTSRGQTLSEHTKRPTVKTEVCEPYGLVIKRHSDDQSDGEVNVQDRNWILAAPTQDKAGKNNSSKPIDSRQEQQQWGQRTERDNKEVKGDRYDSGVSVNYPDTEAGDDFNGRYWENLYPSEKIVFSSEDLSKVGKDHFNRRSSGDREHAEPGSDHHSKFGYTNGFTPKPFPSARNDGREVGPLRWYNPAITPPPPYQPNGSHVSHRTPAASASHGQGSGAAHHSRTTHRQDQSADPTQPRTPTPDYTNEDGNGSLEPPLFNKQNKQPSKPKSHPAPSSNTQPSKPSGHMKRPAPVPPGQLPNVQIPQNFKMSDPPAPPRPPLPAEYKGKALTNNTHIDTRSNAQKEMMAKLNADIVKSVKVKKANSDFLKPPPSPVDVAYHHRSQDDLDQPTQLIVPVQVHYNAGNNNVTSVQQKHQQTSKEASVRPPGRDVKSNNTNQPVPFPREEKASSRTNVLGAVRKEDHAASKEKSHIIHKKDNGPGQQKKENNNAKKQNTTAKESKSTNMSRNEDNNEKIGKDIADETDQRRRSDSPAKEDSNSSGVDSMRSYSAEIGRVLNDLDETLENHGWQASLKKHVKQNRPPLVAYV